MLSERSKLGRLPAFATLLSMVACYGTLAVVASLSALGVAVTVNETLWAGAIVAFALLAVLGLLLGYRRHRRIWPILIGGLGVLGIGYAMYVQYERWIEVSGFVLLGIGVLWDWRLRRVPPSAFRLGA
ncbi:MAG: MerC domain-containing protein [Rhodospirillales bacterium]|nr:MerC domain-containing protein [Rhodospirillales bacterium]